MSPEERLLQEIFSEEGSLARLFGTFEVRDGQLSMAEHVLRAYQEEETALIEAGTGVGKSLAYLVPAVIWALRHQEKTVISTHTIALQEQLLKKDIPFLLKAVDADLKAVLIKGMSNYACLRKLSESPGHPLALWAEEATEGSRSEIGFPVTAELWDEVKAESISCSHVHCPHYRQCFFFKARKEAQDAQLLIVNHHLLLTDIALRQKRSNEDSSILPSYTRLVIDEAHHFEETALDCLSSKVDGVGLLRMIASLFTEKHRAALKEKLSLEKYNKLQHQLEIDLPGERTRLSLLIDEAFKEVKKLIPASNRKRLRSERELLKPKFQELTTALTGYAETLFSLAETIDEKNATVEIVGVAGRLEEAADMLMKFFEGAETLSQVRIGEGSLYSATLVEAELDVSVKLKVELFDLLATAVLCSATLTSNRSFQYVRARLGISEATEEIYESPFDYAGRTLLAVPRDFPDPSSPLFMRSAAKMISEVIEASRGGAFVLFTSYEMLKAMYDLVAPHHDFPFMRQQDASRSVLLERFKSKEGSVLFGTDSFWEGVDVPGDALRCVIIVKLPFRVPSDPIEEAHREALTAQNKDAFTEKNVPEAAIKFKQGFGRLMRTKSDRGTILCLDNRLLTKGYGKYFLNSLPPSRTLFDTSERILAEFRAFYNNPVCML